MEGIYGGVKCGTVGALTALAIGAGMAISPATSIWGLSNNWSSIINCVK
ncbi:hypothetical protein EV142_102564 [Flavobacterium circumlabens]|uniref:Uncharacterized protein n=2 Tax=Flavobacterium circumlabens TaxID=2133765 RepID=A0ABY2B347_9FLAO|nr:hypothetical protein EV142_102564 [Flavobacterium circumlabens]